MFINHASRTRATACLTIRGIISTALSSRRLPGVQKNSKRISSRGDFARLASSLIGNKTQVLQTESKDEYSLKARASFAAFAFPEGLKESPTLRPQQESPKPISCCRPCFTPPRFR
ncbi:hypothetical protein Salat_0191100 [Sesamum alatum]|uniref:Uncharacterized protein n=1 Tax=Sesamum alatum TaxID=300844 RepID=A0AAE1YYE0_9LAMI|nr:hypothetical protein Salat_0191100 [Sesamum alatum]